MSETGNGTGEMKDAAEDAAGHSANNPHEAAGEKSAHPQGKAEEAAETIEHSDDDTDVDTASHRGAGGR